MTSCRKLVTKSISKDGKPQFTGKPKALKSSQTCSQYVVRSACSLQTRNPSNLSWEPRPGPGLTLEALPCKSSKLATCFWVIRSFLSPKVACLLLQQKHMCPLAFCFEAPSDLKLGEIFEEGAFEDCWLDAHMDRVVSYLRADRHLDLPDVLRELFPSHIPPQRP